MDQVVSFCGEPRISINEDKTFELIIRPTHRKTPAEENAKHLLCHHTPIPFQNTGKFIGVTFDNQLSFRTHIKDINTKAKNRSFKLRTLHNTTYGPSNQTMIRLHSPAFRIRTSRNHHYQSQTLTQMGINSNHLHPSNIPYT